MKILLGLLLVFTLTACELGPQVDTPDHWDDKEEETEETEQTEENETVEVEDEKIYLALGETFEYEGVSYTLESAEIEEGEVYEEVLYLIFRIDNNSLDEVDFFYDVTTRLYFDSEEFNMSHSDLKDPLLEILRQEDTIAMPGETKRYARAFQHKVDIQSGKYVLELVNREYEDLEIYYTFSLN